MLILILLGAITVLKCTSRGFLTCIILATLLHLENFLPCFTRLYYIHLSPEILPKKHSLNTLTYFVWP